MKTKKREWHNVDVTGRWKLTYKTTNNIGPSAFGGKHLPVYPSPFDSKKTYRRSVDDKPLKGFMMDRLSIDLFPDENLDHKHLVNWLICHPEVAVVGVPNIDSRILKKKEVCKITLTCVDYLEISDIDEDDFIDKVNGRLSVEGGPQAVGLDRLRYILASLNMTYRNDRYEKKIEKKVLRKSLKNFVRSSVENARIVDALIEDHDNAKDHFIFKEMIRTNVIVNIGGVYKFQNTPLGITEDKTIQFLTNNPDLKISMVSELYKIINSKKNN